MTSPRIGEPGSFGARDTAAVFAAQEYRTGHLPAVRARATAWITMLSSITGVVTAASVISAVDAVGTFTQLHWVAVAALVLGFLCAVVAMLLADDAAHGDGGMFAAAREIVDGQNPEGAGARWDAAIENAASSTRSRQKTSVILAVVGSVLLLGSFVLLWVAKGAAEAEQAVCVEVGGVLIEVSEFNVQEPAEVLLVPCE